MADVSCRSVILRIKFLLIILKLFFLSAGSCLFALVRAHRSRSWCRRSRTGWGSRSLVIHGHHGLDGHHGPIFKVVIVMLVLAVMLVMTKKWLKSNHNNILKFLTAET